MNEQDHELLSQYLDGELGASQVLKLERRLAGEPELQARFEMGRTHLMCADVAYQQGERQTRVSHLTEADHLFHMLQVPIYLELTQQQADTGTARACRLPSPGSDWWRQAGG